MISNNKAAKSVNVTWAQFETDIFAIVASIRHQSLYVSGEVNVGFSGILGRTGWDEKDLIHYQVFMELSTASLDEPLPEAFNINFYFDALNFDVPSGENPLVYNISTGKKEISVANRDWARVTQPILVSEFVARNLKQQHILTIDRHDKSLFEGSQFKISGNIENFEGVKRIKVTTVGSYIGSLGCDDIF